MTEQQRPSRLSRRSWPVAALVALAWTALPVPDLVPNQGLLVTEAFLAGAGVPLVAAVLTWRVRRSAADRGWSPSSR